MVRRIFVEKSKIIQIHLLLLEIIMVIITQRCSSWRHQNGQSKKIILIRWILLVTRYWLLVKVSLYLGDIVTKGRLWQIKTKIVVRSSKKCKSWVTICKGSFFRIDLWSASLIRSGPGPWGLALIGQLSGMTHTYCCAFLLLKKIVYAFIRVTYD